MRPRIRRKKVEASSASGVPKHALSPFGNARDTCDDGLVAARWVVSVSS
jgi:hypothetical protein